MTALTKIPRLQSEDHGAVGQPGWFAVLYNGKRAKPVIQCNCGQLMGIGDHHVHADGRVTASFYDRDGCGWHVFLKLLDYDQGEFPPTAKPLPQAGTK
jgi:hypothetical protein